MSSRRDLIVTDIIAALNTASGKPAGLNVHRQRSLSIGRDILPSMVVYIISEENRTGPGMGARPNPQRKSIRTVTIRVEIRINAGTTAPDQALDQYLTWMVQKIAADPQRSNMADDTLELTTEWASSAEEDAVYAATQTDWSVKYITESADPTTA
jgi:hypothetical protein